MGIVNVTPDSFSDGGWRLDAGRGARARLCSGRGGGRPARPRRRIEPPGSEPVALDEELRRVLPVVEGSAAWTSVPISIDTTKAEVARRRSARARSIINDITALGGDPEMAGVVAEPEAGVVLMHMQGMPADHAGQPALRRRRRRGATTSWPTASMGRVAGHSRAQRSPSTRASASARRSSTTWSSCGTSIDLRPWVCGPGRHVAEGVPGHDHRPGRVERCVGLGGLVAGGVRRGRAASCGSTTSRRWSTRSRSGPRSEAGSCAMTMSCDRVARSIESRQTDHRRAAALCRTLAAAGEARRAKDGRGRRRGQERLAEALGRGPAARSAREILEANAADVAAAPGLGLNAAAIDRLTLDPKRIDEMARRSRDVAALPDPVGEVDRPRAAGPTGWKSARSACRSA